MRRSASRARSRRAPGQTRGADNVDATVNGPQRAGVNSTQTKTHTESSRGSDSGSAPRGAPTKRARREQWGARGTGHDQRGTAQRAQRQRGGKTTCRNSFPSWHAAHLRLRARHDPLSAERWGGHKVRSKPAQTVYVEEFCSPSHRKPRHAESYTAAKEKREPAPQQTLEFKLS